MKGLLLESPTLAAADAGVRLVDVWVHKWCLEQQAGQTPFVEVCVCLCLCRLQLCVECVLQCDNENHCFTGLWCENVCL